MVRSPSKYGDLSESERFRMEGELSQIRLLQVSRKQNAGEADKLHSNDEIR